MSRYDAMFRRIGNQGAFGAFVMLGDPDLERSAGILDGLVEAGADMIEVGLPFSDPVADGPTIQAAAERALRLGVTTADCLALLKAFRSRQGQVPVGVLTYANIVLARGSDAFYSRCAEAGVDSVLIADVPAFEAERFVHAARSHGIAPVLIAAPNTPRETLRQLAELGRGYTYCVARAGVTGAETEMQLDHKDLFGALRDFGAPPPVLGFGISQPDHVRAAIAAGAAGAISGSAIVRIIEQERDPLPALKDFVRLMKAASMRLEEAAELEPGGALRVER